MVAAKKWVVITGGTSGIGKELVKKYENNGYNVMALGLNPNPLINNEHLCDVTKLEELKAYAEKLENVDLLICNAGYGVFGALELCNDDEIKNLFDVNYFGVLNTCKAFLPKMKKGARIIIIGSCCALFPLPFRANYCASKAAVNSLAHGLRMELKHAGIKVSVINPGDVKTPFITNRVKNFETNLRYQGRVQKAFDIVETKNNKRMSASYCASRIYHISRRLKLKSSYIIGAKYKLLYFLSHFVTESCLINIINKKFS